MIFRKSWDLASIPDEPFFRESGRRFGSRHGAGRPPKLARCPRCGEEFGTAAMRQHKPRCEGKESNVPDQTL